MRPASCYPGRLPTTKDRPRSYADLVIYLATFDGTAYEDEENVRLEHADLAREIMKEPRLVLPQLGTELELVGKYREVPYPYRAPGGKGKLSATDVVLVTLPRGARDQALATLWLAEVKGFLDPAVNGEACNLQRIPGYPKLRRQLTEGGRWFNRAGVDQRFLAIPYVLEDQNSFDIRYDGRCGPRQLVSRTYMHGPFDMTKAISARLRAA